MFSKIALSLAAALALGARSRTLAAPVPSSTDEARAMSAESASPECPAAPAARIPASTDEARAQAAATIDRAPTSPSPERAPRTVASTDDARAAAAAEDDEKPVLHACAVPPATDDHA